MKQIEVKINGVTYLPVDPTQISDKPEGEPDVNYRALVNDKLRELGTFYEKEGLITTKETLYLVDVSYANDEMFIITGRVQECLLDVAFYKGNNDFPLLLTIKTDKTWRDVYDLLLKHENFIKRGIN